MLNEFLGENFGRSIVVQRCGDGVQSGQFLADQTRCRHGNSWLRRSREGGGGEEERNAWRGGPDGWYTALKWCNCQRGMEGGWNVCVGGWMDGRINGCMCG